MTLGWPLPVDAQEQQQIPRVLTVCRVGVCGNGICEIGERTLGGVQNGSCPEDCGFASQPCTGGCNSAGTCLATMGTCICWAGYRGPNCDLCASSYVRSKGLCVPNVVELGLNSVEASTGVPNGGNTTGAPSTAGALAGRGLLVHNQGGRGI